MKKLLLLTMAGICALVAVALMVWAYIQYDIRVSIAIFAAEMAMAAIFSAQDALREQREINRMKRFAEQFRQRGYYRVCKNCGIRVATVSRAGADEDEDERYNCPICGERLVKEETPENEKRRYCNKSMGR